MDVKEFTEKMAESLKKAVGNEEKIFAKETVGSNGTLVHMVCAGVGGALLNFHMDQLYHVHQWGMSLEACFRMIKQQYDEAVLNAVRSEDFLSKENTWNILKDHVYPVLLPQDRVAPDLVSCPCFDLQMTYMVRLPGREDWIPSMKVTKEMLRVWGIEERQLLESAARNLAKDSTVEISETVLKEERDSPEEADLGHAEKAQKKVFKMYILSNKEKYYGASALLNIAMLQKIADGRDLFLCPSSVHEIIAVADCARLTQDGIDEMIREINETHVLEEERLGDHSYFYDHRKNEVRIRK